MKHHKYYQSNSIRKCKPLRIELICDLRIILQSNRRDLLQLQQLRIKQSDIPCYFDIHSDHFSLSLIKQYQRKSNRTEETLDLRTTSKKGEIRNVSLSLNNYKQQTPDLDTQSDSNPFLLPPLENQHKNLYFRPNSQETPI